MPIKIAMIGAGSIGFTRRLLHDVLAMPELADTTFAFTDISQHNLDMVTQLCQRNITANKLPATVKATTDRRTAIADANYVMCAIRQGGLHAFQTNIDIPLKYGINQCVGDTICAGGSTSVPPIKATSCNNKALRHSGHSRSTTVAPRIHGVLGAALRRIYPC